MADESEIWTDWAGGSGRSDPLDEELQDKLNTSNFSVK